MQKPPASHHENHQLMMDENNDISANNNDNNDNDDNDNNKWSENCSDGNNSNNKDDDGDDEDVSANAAEEIDDESKEEEEDDDDEFDDDESEEEEDDDDDVKNNNNNNDDCERIRRNDPTFTKYGSFVDDAKLIRLGNALLGNTMLEFMQLQLGNELTIQGAETLAEGIRSSKLSKIVIICKRKVDGGTINNNEAIVRTLYLQGVQHCQTMLSLEVVYNVGDVSALAVVIPKLMSLSIYGHALSVFDVQILGLGLRASLQLIWLEFHRCDLGNEHLHVLGPIIGNLPSLQMLQLSGNKIEDEGVSSFVQHWRPSLIKVLNFAENMVGPLGAQRLMKAVANNKQTRMHELGLSWNQAIGFDGLKLIGDELPGTKLRKLYLSGNVEWAKFNNVNCEAAVQQNTKCMKAGRALLEGVRANYYLEELDLEELHLPLEIMMEIDVYSLANKNHRHLLLEQTTLPAGLWCYILAKRSQTTSTIFLFLRELDVLLTHH